MSELQTAQKAAESEWLDKWTEGPREKASRSIGIKFQDGRRLQGRPPVDDPWRGAAEFVVGADGVIRLAYDCQYCEDYPDPRVLTTAARLS